MPNLGDSRRPDFNRGKIPTADSAEHSDRQHPDLPGRIRQRARQMPPLHRKVLVLYYFKNLRLNEIARRCGRSEAVIAQVCAECLPAIHKAMEELTV